MSGGGKILSSKAAVRDASTCNPHVDEIHAAVFDCNPASES
jgi:hypothetical protein